MKKRYIHKVFAILLLAGLCSAALAGAQKSDDPDVLLQAAIHKETIEGDLEQAIRMYQDIVSKHSSVRAVAASALLRMGQVYEKLGNGDARKAYEQVIRKYANQTQVAAAARPIDDHRSTAAYRRHAVEVLARRALARTFDGVA